jgi:ABC-type glycerol-3-phosphate transport system permease component
MGRHRMTLRSVAKTTISSVFLSGVVLFIVVPFLMVVFASLKPFPELNDIANRTVLRRIFPDNFLYLENYRLLLTGSAKLLNGVPFTLFIRNSLIVTLGSLVPASIVSLLAAHGFAVYDFPLKDAAFMLILSLLMVPDEMLSVPLYLVVARIGLVNTFVGIMLPSLVSVFGIYLMREAISVIPREYIECARIDGARELWILARVIAPMTRTSLVTFVIIKFFGTWNDYFWPLLVVTKEEIRTVTLGLAKFTTEIFQVYNELNAGVVLSLLPTLVLFFATRRYITRGLSAFGLKG